MSLGHSKSTKTISQDFSGKSLRRIPFNLSGEESAFVVTAIACNSLRSSSKQFRQLRPQLPRLSLQLQQVTASEITRIVSPFPSSMLFRKPRKTHESKLNQQRSLVSALIIISGISARVNTGNRLQWGAFATSFITCFCPRNSGTSRVML